MNKKGIIITSILIVLLLFVMCLLQNKAEENNKETEVIKNITIYLEPEGGLLDIDKISLKDIDSYLELPSPIKDGYIFIGWYTEKIGGIEKEIEDLYNIDSDIILHAQYQLINNEIIQEENITTKQQLYKYNISFNTNGGTKLSPLKIYEGTKIIISELPRKTGYTFMGWKETIPTYMPKKDLVLTALWSPNKYKITFNTLGGNNIEKKEVLYDSKYGELPKAIKTGYTFTGWYNEDNEKIEETTIVNVLADTKLYADYIANKYNVTFDAGEGITDTKAKEVTYDSEYGELPKATRTGYTFKGWYTDNNEKIEETDIVKITEEIKLYAKYEANKYKVNFDAGEGITDIGKKEVLYDSEYGELPKAIKTGYTFTGWYNENNEKIEETDTVQILENITLYAKYEANKYKVNFDAGEGITDVKAKEVIYDSEYGELPKATRTGYTFKGWYTNVTGGIKIDKEDIVKITEETTLYAQYDIIKITSITLNYSSGAFLYSFGTYKANVSILPLNAGNQNLKFEIINPSYSGISVNEKTGDITYIDNGKGGSCNAVQIKASAQDGSGVYIIKKMIMEKPNEGCWTPRY